MRKIFISLFLILSLCGCTAENKTDIVPLIHETAEKSTIDEDLLLAYLSDREETHFSISDPIRPFDLNGVACDLELYSIFYEDRIISLAVHKEDVTYVENERLLNKLNEDEYNLIIQTEEGLCLLSKDDVVSFDEEQKISEEEMEKMEAMKTRISVPNPLNKAKREFEVKKTEKQGKTTRIVVRFTQGDEEEKAKMFEEFSGAKLLNRMNSTSLYVYQIGYDTEKALKKLIENCASLEYVEMVQIDGQSELIDPVKKEG